MSTENPKPLRVIRPTGCAWKGNKLPFGGTIHNEKGNKSPKPDAFGSEEEYKQILETRENGLEAMWKQHKEILAKRKKVN